jgi:enoyl-CoA hydratase/carnithine racemase
MLQDPLIYREEGEIAFIEINRSEMKNALNHECWQLLDKYCDRIIDENKIRALVITGRPDDIFSAGVGEPYFSSRKFY